MDKGFFGSLFDLSFENYITPRIISVIYVLSMVFIGLGTISYAFSGFTENSTMGAVTLVSSPLVFLFLVIMTRMYCEVIVALIKIAQNTRGLNKTSNPPDTERSSM